MIDGQLMGSHKISVLLAACMIQSAASCQKAAEMVNNML